MKLRSHLLGSWSLWVLAAMLCLSLTAAPTPEATNNPARSSVAPAPQDSPATAPEVPQSVFITPRTPQQGRDPFFPNSTRLFAAAAIAKPNQPVPTPAVELLLKGFSGVPNHRLAIINNNTFAVGEAGDVKTATGRVHVRCLEIKADSVIIQIGTERRELRLRAGV